MSRNKGWIRLHRNITDHWIFQEKSFSKFQAWVDLCMMANHKDRKILLGNELIEVKRGSFITSELKLMNKWGWSKTKLRNFLELLESDNMIIKKSDTKKTTLTIVNYNAYQDTETIEEPVKDHEKTAEELEENYEETTKRHKQELKNYKELKNDNKYVSMHDENFQEIMNLYTDNIGQVLPVVGEQLKIISEEVPADLFKEAVIIAVDKNKRYIRFIEGVLKNWKDDKINTLSDLEVSRREKQIERDQAKEVRNNESVKPNSNQDNGFDKNKFLFQG